MEYTVPGSRFGIRQSTLRTRFSFILVHHDSVRQSSYIYRGEVLLRAGPKRTFEILTPVVRATDGQPVICRMMNISRDTFHGALTMRDTVVNPVSKSVYLQGKDAVLVDTLFLSLRGPLPSGDHPISVSLPGGVQESIIARSFEARVDTQARVALLTAFDESPIAHALDRVGIPWRRINRSVTAGQGLARTNVIIIDRDALTELRGQGAQPETIMAWVREGGHLLVLPQNDVPEGGAWFIPGASFRTSPLLSPDAAVRTDSAYALLRSPNVLSEGDWDGWVVARSLCSVKVAGDRPAQVIVSSLDRDIPLVVTLPEGKGRITLIALDLISQLVNVHPGGHRIFANLLKP
jgi:hypothetical protein